MVGLNLAQASAGLVVMSQPSGLRPISTHTSLSSLGQNPTLNPSLSLPKSLPLLPTPALPIHRFTLAELCDKRERSMMKSLGCIIIVEANTCYSWDVMMKTPLPNNPLKSPTIPLKKFLATSPLFRVSCQP